MANAASQGGVLSSYLQQTLPFWSVLTAPQRQLLLSNTTLYKYQPGTRIYEIGSVFQGLLALRSGRLRAFIYSADSREASLFTLHEGELSVLALSEVRERCRVELCFEVLQPSELGLAPVLAPRGELSASAPVSIALEQGTARVAGYRLLAFYP